MGKLIQTCQHVEVSPSGPPTLTYIAYFSYVSVSISEIIYVTSLLLFIFEKIITFLIIISLELFFVIIITFSQISFVLIKTFKLLTHTFN